MALIDVLKKVQVDREAMAGERLFAHIRKSVKAREKMPMKPGDCYRASSLGYLCIRQEVLAAKYEIIRVEDVNPGANITYDIGDVFHDLYRDKYYGPMGEWVGAWKCIVCDWNTDVEGLSSPPIFDGVLRSTGKLAKKPDVCGKCGSELITFKEWELEDNKIGLSGHPDGWSLRVGRDRVLVDLKSHTKTGFISRNTTIAGHDLQVLAYAHMTGDTRGQVWYLNKSPWGDSLSFVREIDVDIDNSRFESFIKRPLCALQDALVSGKIPERVCVDKACSKARECQLFDVCFDFE